MNTREANAVAEVLRQIDHGPGNGWRELLADCGEEGGRDGKGTDLRLADFQLWRDTWIRPALAAVVARYFKTNRRRGALGTPGASKAGARLRATLREAEAKEARGVESSAYWVGFYKSIATRAIDELETREALG